MADIAERYLRFARNQAAGISPLYESLAVRVAQSPALMAFLGGLPPARQQPNLLFAAARLVCGTPETPEAFEATALERSNDLAEVMLSRTTQTNEPARCSTLLPALAHLSGPLALIEVGTSAGLCLLMDRYGYDWGERQLPAVGDAPTFVCKTSGPVPYPDRHPEIVWRAGLDLNPLDLTRDDDVGWLETLVWPEQQDRLERLRAAIRYARKDPPRLVRGNLLHDLPALMAEAPKDATLVVFHTAVVTYVADQADRDRFARDMIASDAVWICNEGLDVFPAFSQGIDPIRENRYLMSVNGTPVAWTGSHGQDIHWL